MSFATRPPVTLPVTVPSSKRVLLVQVLLAGAQHESSIVVRLVA
jgi:hypothetical protein